MDGNSGGGGRYNRRLGVSEQGGGSDEDQLYGRCFSAGVKEGTVGRSRADPLKSGGGRRHYS